jgi:hypothetical protein
MPEQGYRSDQRIMSLRLCPLPCSSEKWPAFCSPMHVFLLPDARRDRGICGPFRYRNPARRRHVDALPVQHHGRETLLLLEMRHLHPPSAAVEPEPIWCQCRMLGWLERLSPFDFDEIPVNGVVCGRGRNDTVRRLWSVLVEPLHIFST